MAWRGVAWLATKRRQTGEKEHVQYLEPHLASISEEGASESFLEARVRPGEFRHIEGLVKLAAHALLVARVFLDRYQVSCNDFEA